MNFVCFPCARNMMCTSQGLGLGLGSGTTKHRRHPRRRCVAQHCEGSPPQSPTHLLVFLFCCVVIFFFVLSACAFHNCIDASSGGARASNQTSAETRSSGTRKGWGVTLIRKTLALFFFDNKDPLVTSSPNTRTHSHAHTHTHAFRATSSNWSTKKGKKKHVFFPPRALR